MELTKQERHVAYTECLNDINSGLVAFCCESFVKRNYMTWKDEASIMFPELFNLRNDGRIVFWFSDNSQRIEALKKCIEQTKCD